MVTYILGVVCAFLLLGADQLTKYLISSNMTLGEGKEFINGIIDIVYIHNTGGAWGMLSGYTWVLLSLTVIAMLVCITLLLKSGMKSKLLFWSICLIISGGIGNFIVRIFRGGNVVDFLHFEFWPTFPIFNVADICVVVGAGLLVLYFIIDTVKESKKAKIKSEIEENE